MHVLTGLVYGFVGLDEEDVPGLHAQTRGFLEARPLDLEIVVSLGYIRHIERDRAGPIDGAFRLRHGRAFLQQRESNGPSGRPLTREQRHGNALRLPCPQYRWSQGHVAIYTAGRDTGPSRLCRGRRGYDRCRRDGRSWCECRCRCGCDLSRRGGGSGNNRGWRGRSRRGGT